MSPQTILFVDHAASLGGAERSLLLLQENLDPAIWSCALAGVPGALLEAAAQRGTAVYPLPLPRLRRSPRFLAHGLQSARALAHLARKTDAALLYANTVRAAIYTALAAKIARRPFVWHMRDFWLSENRPHRLWPDTAGKRLLTAMAALVIANSQATADHLPSSARVRVVPNGIDVRPYDPSLDGRAFRARHHIPADAPVVGMVGRLRPWKGQIPFLHMAAHIHQQAPQVHFLIVGGDPFGVDEAYPQQLQALAASLHLSERVTFSGQTDDVPGALASLDVFVHPGDPEPFGLVNLEAMAMAKPVVAFAHGALPEIVLNGHTGWLVPPNDEAALSTAVLHLLHDPAERQRLGMAGRERVLAEFTAARMAAGVSATLTAVIQEKPL